MFRRLIYGAGQRTVHSSLKLMIEPISSGSWQASSTQKYLAPAAAQPRNKQTLDESNLRHSTDFLRSEVGKKEGRRIKAQRESNPQPHELLLPRLDLYRWATTAALSILKLLSLKENHLYFQVLIFLHQAILVFSLIFLETNEAFSGETWLKANKLLIWSCRRPRGRRTRRRTWKVHFPAQSESLTGVVY